MLDACCMISVVYAANIPENMCLNFHKSRSSIAVENDDVNHTIFEKCVVGTQLSQKHAKKRSNRHPDSYLQSLGFCKFLHSFAKSKHIQLSTNEIHMTNAQQKFTNSVLSRISNQLNASWELMYLKI